MSRQVAGATNLPWGRRLGLLLFQVRSRRMEARAAEELASGHGIQHGVPQKESCFSLPLQGRPEPLEVGLLRTSWKRSQSQGSQAMDRHL